MNKVTKTTGVVSERSIRYGLEILFRDCQLDLREFCRKNDLIYVASHEYLEGRRQIKTKTLDRIIAGLTTDQFFQLLSNLDEGEPESASSFSVSDAELVKHPAFLALTANIFKNCEMRMFQELFLLISYSRRNEDAYRVSAPLGDVNPSRIPIRDAFNATMFSCQIKPSELAKTSGVAHPLLSRYQAQYRDLTTKTIENILNAFTSEEYACFIGIFREAFFLLERLEPGLGEEPLRDDRDFQFHAYCNLLSLAVRSCTDPHYEDLFLFIAESRKAARTASGDDLDTD